MQDMSDDEAREVIAANVSRLRGDRSLSDIARACDTSAGAIQQIERGDRMPGAGLMTRLAAAFGVSLDDLVKRHKNSRRSA
jgi:transcriptional regulator with XRE-family HTH domain